MEWVETTGKSVDEAKEKALDQLGVHMEDAEFDILEEPKPGLFGRLKGEARVRARVRPAQVRQKLDRRDRRRERGDKDKASKSERSDQGERAESGESGDRPKSGNGRGGRGRSQGQKKEQGAPSGSKPARNAPSADRPARATAPKPAAAAAPSAQEDQAVEARQVGEEASRFMTGLLESFGLQGSVELVEDGDDLELRVHGSELGLLVGPRGTTLQAVQDLARVASQRRLGDHDTRLRVDIGGYRERRRAALGKFAVQMADEVKASGVARVLEPMSSADRKVIHDTLSEVEGIATRSEGDDPFRRVIIAPAND